MDNRPAATRRPSCDDPTGRPGHHTGCIDSSPPRGGTSRDACAHGCSEVERCARSRASSRSRTDGLPRTKRVHGLHALEAESAHPDSNRDARGKSPVRCRYGHEPVAPAGFEPASVRLGGGCASDRATGQGPAVTPAGIEPAIQASEARRRSSPGAGSPPKGGGESGRLDSNQRPPASEAGALPTAPLPEVIPAWESKNGRGESNPYLRLGRPSCCPLNTTPAWVPPAGGKYARLDSNQRPSAYQADALPAELRTFGIAVVQGPRRRVSRAGFEPATPRSSPASSTL